MINNINTLIDRLLRTYINIDEFTSRWVYGLVFIIIYLISRHCRCLFVLLSVPIKRWQLAFKNRIRLPSKIGYQLDINIPGNYSTNRFLHKLELVIEKLYLTDTSLILKLGYT